MEVVKLIRDIVVSDAPTVRYPVGTMMNQPVGEFVQTYIATPWTEIERMRLV
ncbi:hypothetical protein [Alicyclobacillus sp. ALC3]|uniref:hypothetical protein n=1 Tax=Alicyclobacillus sp. ALC3 TaxID=2796143 RepID=UPI002378118B|nr:hypothetical protein [Alicyclobacillus sp. ALC3]WDL96211.1 hypothetical protein JC200_18020 [Alicyclobacillus sp. ALC3]